MLHKAKAFMNSGACCERAKHCRRDNQNWVGAQCERHQVLLLWAAQPYTCEISSEKYRIDGRVQPYTTIALIAEMPHIMQFPAVVRKAGPANASCKDIAEHSLGGSTGLMQVGCASVAGVGDCVDVRPRRCCAVSRRVAIQKACVCKGNALRVTI